MQIIVATKNIFRRELTSYTLIEAGHDVREISEHAQLAQYVVREQPALIIADATIAGLDTFLQIVRQQSMVPVLWLGRDDAPRNVGSGVGYLDWPYRPDELLSAVIRLGGRELTPAMPTVLYTQRVISQNE